MNGKLKAALLLGVMYGFGVLTGVFWQTHCRRPFMAQHPAYAERRLQRIKAQLQLTRTQEEAVRKIFQKARERASQVNDEVSWDLSDIHRDSVTAIQGVLSREQLQKFERLHHRFHTSHSHIPNENNPTPTPRAKADS